MQLFGLWMAERGLGTIPDWLGAIGSVGAVAAALLLGLADRRRAIRAEETASTTRGLERAQFLGMVVGSISSVQSVTPEWLGHLKRLNAMGVLMLEHAREPEVFAARDRYVDVCQRMRAVVVDMRAIPSNNAMRRAYLLEVEKALELPSGGSINTIGGWLKHFERQVPELDFLLGPHFDKVTANPL